MIASTRGIIALAAIAVVLALCLVLGGSGQPAAVDRSLVPGFDPAKITELSFARAGVADVVLRKTGDVWRWVSPEGAADPVTVDGVLTALRGAHWHRKAARRIAGGPRGKVRVVAAGSMTELEIAAAIEGGDQTWVLRGDTAYLVDNWVATALLPEPLALRVRQPLAAAASAKAIASNALSSIDVRVEGMRLVKPRAVWLDPARVDALVEAMTKVEIVALGPPTLDPAARGGITLEGPARQVTLAGTCSGTRLFVHATDGDGCVERAAWDAITTVLAKLNDPAAEIADPRPLPIVPATLVLGDGAVLEIAGRPRIGSEDADPDRVRDLVAALTAKGVFIPRPARKPSKTLVATDANGVSVTLEVFDGGLVARAGEDLAIHVMGDEAWRAIMRPSSAFRDPVLWREDETTVQSITVDGVTFDRGALIGEWTRSPAGEVDAALVDALAQALASLRAPSTTQAVAATRKIAVTFAPPSGKPTTHELAIAPPGPEGCAAKVDGASVLLPLPLCTAAFAISP